MAILKLFENNKSLLNFNKIIKYNRFSCLKNNNSKSLLVFQQYRLNSTSNPNNKNDKINKSNSLNRNKELKAKARLNLPPSFRTSHPLPKNQISESELNQINNSNNDNNDNQIQPITFKNPWWTPFLKLGVVFVPFFIFGIGYITYETMNNRPVFFPLWINSSVPLDKAIGFENIDVEMLKEVARSNLLRRLNMNHEIREYFGLPITLSNDYESFDIRIEYNKLAVEGIELDFRKNWFKPIVKYREIDTPILPSNINKYVQPLKMRTDNGDIDQDPDQDSLFIDDNADYKIKIRGTIKIVNELIHRIEPGSGKITFDAEVELDHTRLMKITGCLMHFRNKNGSGSGGTLERLW